MIFELFSRAILKNLSVTQTVKKSNGDKLSLIVNNFWEKIILE
jgi:hypothetical protein